MDAGTAKLLEDAVKQAHAPSVAPPPPPGLQQIMVNMEINGELQQVPLGVAHLYTLNTIVEKLSRLVELADQTSYVPLDNG